MRRLPILLVALTLVAPACAAGSDASPTTGTVDVGARKPAATTSTTSTTTTTPATSTTELVISTTTIPEPEYTSVISEIDPDLAASITPTSWRGGCPVALDGLRHVQVSHFDNDGNVAVGELIVHRDHADAIAQVFETLFDAEFPIARMELVDAYGGDDDASMAANNTSAFNCRTVAGRPGVWSHHAFGAAIDVNPLVNPYVTSGGVFPPEGEAYADRAVAVPGLIRDGDVVVEAFASIGWAWGGSWSGAKDYQHFSASGR